jgi:hypothetical protein
MGTMEATYHAADDDHNDHHQYNVIDQQHHFHKFNNHSTLERHERIDKGKGIKLAMTILTMLVLVGGLIAGVMDTKVRVNVLERDTKKLEGCLEKHVDKADKALEKIQEGIHRIDKEQAAQGQRLKNWLERENP